MKILKWEEYFSRIPLMMRLFYDDLVGGSKQPYEDVYYGEHRRQYYRIFKGNGQDLPVLFFVHGGGWWHGSPRFSSAVGRFFCKKGYTVILPAYRLVPEETYPKQIEDVIKAFAMAVKKEKLKNKKVIAMGFSAGGELGARLVFDKKLHEAYGIDEGLFKGFISLSGVLDFSLCKSGYAKVLIKNYVKGDYKVNEINPIDLIHPVSFLVLCLHGRRDKLIDPLNAKYFVKRVQEAGSRAAVKEMKQYHHSDIINLVIGKGTKETSYILDFFTAVMNGENNGETNRKTNRKTNRSKKEKLSY